MTHRTDGVKVIVYKSKIETEQEWKQWKWGDIHYESEICLMV